ncbi:FMN-binding protein [Bulleidia sp. zg-1006]|uniref:FMN-binding protein n=1 Tax=Bulleidia sp. zg-1006 TaxID=2806552 RepID=UPI001939F565|nr:FMN-binding protein [Bulleidia sp. zg-1006]QRG86531.1 FMN-binding protein [Bulleidia sp. zg-1006]
MKLNKLMVVAASLVLLAGCSSKKAVYKAGTYEGKAVGRNGNVVVSVTVSDTAITKVELKEHKETAGLSDAAIKDIPEAIVKKNSTEVDGASGATITSNAIKEAVKAALAKAKAK